MKIGLVTDSTCDLNPDLLKKYGIEMVPLNINFAGDEVYKDIIDIKQETFFNKLIQLKKIPTTSQPAIGLFVEKYQEMSVKYDIIISIHLSSKLSGTYKSALLAAQEIENIHIEVIDSCSASIGIGYQVLLAKRLIDEGMEVDDIVKYIKKTQENISIYFTLNDLTYLQKGGRIGKAQAFLGSVLSFYPILYIEKNGEILPFEKVRGKKKIVKRLVNIIMDELEGEEKASLGFVHASELKHYNSFKNILTDRLREENLDYTEKVSWISSVLGCHVGPSVYGIVLVKGEILDI